MCLLAAGHQSTPSLPISGGFPSSMPENLELSCTQAQSDSLLVTAATPVAQPSLCLGGKATVARRPIGAVYTSNWDLLHEQLAQRRSIIRAAGRDILHSDDDPLLVTAATPVAQPSLCLGGKATVARPPIGAVCTSKWDLLHEQLAQRRSIILAAGRDILHSDDDRRTSTRSFESTTSVGPADATAAGAIVMIRDGRSRSPSLRRVLRSKATEIESVSSSDEDAQPLLAASVLSPQVACAGFVSAVSDHLYDHLSLASLHHVEVAAEHQHIVEATRSQARQFAEDEAFLSWVCAQAERP